MVVRVEKPKVANTDYWEVCVAYPVACKSVLVLDREPMRGEELPEGKVTWVKPDDEKPNHWAVGINVRNKTVIKRRTVFMKKIPKIGSWEEVRFI